MKDYDIMKIEGKNGMINLHIPKDEPTKQDYDDIHKVVAEIIINSKNKKKEPANKK